MRYSYVYRLDNDYEPALSGTTKASNCQAAGLENKKAERLTIKHGERAIY